MSDKTVGVIGLGIMGGAIAKNLCAAGWRVVGFEHRCGALRARRRAAGRTIAGSARADAQHKPNACSSACRMPCWSTIDALVAAKLPPRVFAELSTFSLDDKANAEKAQLRAAGRTMLDCPLSGTGAQALHQDLVVYASGNTAGDPRA